MEKISAKPATSSFLLRAFASSAVQKVTAVAMNVANPALVSACLSFPAFAGGGRDVLNRNIQREERNGNGIQRMEQPRDLGNQSLD